MSRQTQAFTLIELLVVVTIPPRRVFAKPRHRTGRAVPRAFTLIELLVVVTIIVVLLALLVPAMDKAIQQAERAVCATNQKVISTACVLYGLGNRKQLFLPRGREVMISFDPQGTQAHSGTQADALVDWPAALASVGLASEQKQQLDEKSIHGETPDDPLYQNNLPGKMWDCPTRVGEFQTYWASSPLFQPSGYTLLTGYQYMGGLAVWRNPLGMGNMSNPPVPRRLGDPGRRALTADVSAKIENVWGGRPGNVGQGESWYAAGSPPHRREDGRPDGQNQSYLDGSVEYVAGDKLFMFHTWNSNPRELFFYWQEDFGGWTPPADNDSWARNQ